MSSAADLSEFLAQSHTAGRGRIAQRAAERYLETAGYRIVGRNWSCKAGEIDVIAFEGNVLCFIEVKARSRPEYGEAISAVTSAKQRRLARAASMLLAQCRWNGSCRFDVLGLDRVEDGWSFTLVRDAFEAG
jgi:putative endonuclease